MLHIYIYDISRLKVNNVWQNADTMQDLKKNTVGLSYFYRGTEIRTLKKSFFNQLTD